MLELIYVGRATKRKLAACGIHTVGDIAAVSPEFLKRILCVNGVSLWTFAAGKDAARVMPMDYEVPIKSIGHGITCIEDLVTAEEVFHVLLQLAQDVSRKLRQKRFSGARRGAHRQRQQAGLESISARVWRFRRKARRSWRTGDGYCLTRGTTGTCRCGP